MIHLFEWNDEVFALFLPLASLHTEKPYSDFTGESKEADLDWNHAQQNCKSNLFTYFSLLRGGFP